ncbi:MAG: FtsQ-type POTRA domain-containing protein [Nocardioidaceae bacterium]|nr:FtsQ-type POTRA domain-containing protein [Nocardioidaceae bacterium]
MRSSRPWIIAVILVAVVAVIAWLLLLSPHLAAGTVDVLGVRRLSEREVLAAADVDRRTPLLRLDLDEIHDRVAAVPEVATVVVHRAWPDTVRISVTEREALAVVRDGERWWAMDQEGVLFADSTDRKDLPTQVPVVEVARQGGRDARAEVAAVMGILAPGLLAEVKSINAPSMDSITLHLNGAKKVMWGSGADSERKAQVLEILLAETKADTIDVSVPQQPTTQTAD